MTKDLRSIPSPETGCLRESAQRSFARDLPQLLRDHRGGWVAYHGERQVALARHTGELYQLCRQQHLPLEEVLLLEIVAPDEEIPFGPMAFD